jgi:hypothetical protein
MPGTAWTCVSAAGGNGQPCGYNNSCAPGLTCDLNRHVCGTAGMTLDCNGPNTFFVGQVDANHCANGFFTAHTQTAEEAQSCADMALRRAGSTDTTVSPTEHTVHQDYCQHGITNVTFHSTAFSDDDLLTCAQNHCTNCTVTEGACPR